MSDFTAIDTWVKTNLVPVTSYSEVTTLMLEELRILADNEPLTKLAAQAYHILKNERGDNQIRALASLRLPNTPARHDQHMDYAFSLVLLKSDPTSTDGIFIILQIVPNQYVLRTIIRSSAQFKALGLTHTLFSQYETNFVKPTIITAVANSATQHALFELKRKYDNYDRIYEVVYGNNDEFMLTLPDGTTVVP